MITTGIFPDSLKKSKITPLFKKGDQSLLLNYRPFHCYPPFQKYLTRKLYPTKFK